MAAENDTKMDGKSLDITKENIAVLKELFPEIVTEGKIDFDKLKLILGEEVDSNNERYNFTWHGKNQAIRLSQTPSMGTLRPCKEESVNWDTTQNLYIEGDNLEVLKLLQKSYFGKIKMIYIDPPYNTGKDRVYPDDYSDGIANYKMITGQMDEDGNRLTVNVESDGRYHTNWLNMMYPRLKLARNLLSEDGSIFIHIDEHEVCNLTKICSEIFGEKNHLGTIIWDKRNPKGATSGVAYQHESILAYSKNNDAFSKVPFSKEKEHANEMLDIVKKLVSKHKGVNDIVRAEYRKWIKEHKNELSGGESAYRNIDDDGNIYQPVSMAAPDKPETRSHRPLLHPKTKMPCPVPKKGWRYTDAAMDQLILEHKIVYGVDENTQPRQKYYLKDNIFESFSSLLYYGGSEDASGLPFDNPKPTYVVKKIISSICRGENDIILDFFSGSSTTARAILQLNAEDAGLRRFICVQLPEPIEEGTDAHKKGYRNICEIGKERIRITGTEVKEKYTQTTIFGERDNSDVGFKVLKLDSSNIKKWNPSGDLKHTLLEYENNIVSDSGRTNLDIVYEIMLKMGLELTSKIDVIENDDATLYSISSGALMMCLDDIKDTTVAEKMISIYKEQNPFVWKVVFKDNGFASDDVKANARETLKMAGLPEGSFVTL